LEQNHIIRPKLSQKISDSDEVFQFSNFPFFHKFSENLYIIRGLYEKEEQATIKRIQKYKTKKNHESKHWVEIFKCLYKSICWQGRYVHKRKHEHNISNLKWDQNKYLQNFITKNLKHKLKNTIKFKSQNIKHSIKRYLEEENIKGTQKLWKTVYEARNKIEKQTSFLSFINSDEIQKMSMQQKRSIRLSRLIDKMAIKMKCSIIDFFDLVESEDVENYMVKKRINRTMYECLLLEILIARVDHCKSNYWQIKKMGLSPTTLQRIKQNSYFLEGLYSHVKSKSCMILNGMIIPVKKELLECRKKFHNSNRLEFVVQNIKVSKAFRWRFQQLFTDSLSLFEKVQDEKKFRQLSHFFSFYLDLKLQIRQKQLIFTLFKTCLDNLFLKSTCESTKRMNNSKFLILNQIMFGQTHMPKFGSPLEFCNSIYRRFCQNDIILKHFPKSVILNDSHHTNQFTSHQTISEKIKAFENNIYRVAEEMTPKRNNLQIFNKVFYMLDNLEDVQLLKLSSTLSQTDTVFEDDRFLFGSFQVQLPFYFLHELGLHFILNWNLQLFASRLYRTLFNFVIFRIQ
jgi:hypothetical protein